MESVGWLFYESFIFGVGFPFCVVGSIGLAGWGILHRSGSALGLSAALALPSAFLLALSGILTPIDELSFWLARDTLWTAVALSPLVAILGVWRQSRMVLLMSAALSVPFGLGLFPYPGTRFYLALPFVHLLAAVTVRGKLWWTSWVMLLLIIGLEMFFLLRLGGLGLPGISQPQ